MKELETRGIKVVADLSTEAGQADFAADVIKLKGANADAIFVYLNEEESARFLIEAKKQGIDKPLIGETTLLGQKVIDLAKGCGQRRQGPRRPHRRCADPGDPGVRQEVRRPSSATSPTTTA